MKLSLASRRSGKAGQERKKAGMLRVDSVVERLMEQLPQTNRKLKSTSVDWTIVVLAWAMATGLGSVAWAITNYLIEHEKQRTQVELARLDMKAKKKGSSH
jgi:hypothetical protein